MRSPHNRLRGKMKHDLRAGFCNGGLDGVEIVQVAERRIQTLANARHFVKARIAFRRQRETVNFGAESIEPERKPSALEAGMAGQENPPAG
jgi:hypothetical protein